MKKHLLKSIAFALSGAGILLTIGTIAVNSKQKIKEGEKASEIIVTMLENAYPDCK